MKTDIKTRNDIKRIITLFYKRVKDDDVIGFFFTEVVPLNWDKHIAGMCAFWENVLFYTGEYEGNPMVTHREVHGKHPTTEAHFERWLLLFTRTVDELYKGENATTMKERAESLAAIMQKGMK